MNKKIPKHLIETHSLGESILVNINENLESGALKFKGDFKGNITYPKQVLLQLAITAWEGEGGFFYKNNPTDGEIFAESTAYKKWEATKDKLPVSETLKEHLGLHFKSSLSAKPHHAIGFLLFLLKKITGYTVISGGTYEDSNDYLQLSFYESI